MRKLFSLIVIAVAFLCSCSSKIHQSAGAISIISWGGISAEKSDTLYSLAKECGFDMHLGLYRAKESAVASMDAAARQGIDVIISFPQIKDSTESAVALIKDHPALYAYHLKDEPDTSDFGWLAELAGRIGELDPSHPCYINLLPNWSWGVEEYPENLEQFASEVDVPFYSFDNYPIVEVDGCVKVRPGDPKYRDINHDGLIDDNDRTIIGCGQPLHTGGFGNTFNFYGFDLNIFFSWSYGNDVINANRLYFENGSITNTNQLKSYKDRWTVKNPDSDIPRVGADIASMFVYSSRVVEDASFLRLRNVTLGYTLPRKVLRKMNFDTMRFYISGENLWTLTKYSGPDPEVSTRNSVLTPGFDWSAYPRALGVTAGLSFTF